MTNEIYLKQEKNKPLFENLLWSRPENKALAGRLLIIGGNTQGFKAPATAYSLALKAGMGTIKVLLPDSLRKIVETHIEGAIFESCNSSGSFSKSALASSLEHASWADLVLLAGDFGKNSETAIFLESLIYKYKGPLVITGDSINALLIDAPVLAERSYTLVVTNLDKLQKLVMNMRYPRAIVSSISLLQLVDLLKELTTKFKIGLITNFMQHIIVAVDGNISVTKIEKEENGYSLVLASYSSTWWAQNPNKMFEALTTAIFEIEA